jgi:hypothetical protein
LRIDVTNAGPVLTKARRSEIRRRVRLAMGRFELEVDRVKLRLSESKNPLGGVDQCCSVEARLQTGLVLRAEAIDGQEQTAAGRCATRLALLVAAVSVDGAVRPRSMPPSRL